MVWCYQSNSTYHVVHCSLLKCVYLFVLMLRVDMVNLEASDDYVVYNWYTGEIAKLAASVTLAQGYEGTLLVPNIVSVFFGTASSC